MKYKVIELKNYVPAAAKTEIMFEIASERASGTELVRFNIKRIDDERAYRRAVSAFLRLIKQMKERGAVQFFATPESFSELSTEARFLLNKYPDLFADIPTEDESGTFVYVRV